ncbi:MAG TPA: hypothetical protein DDW52_24715 [Planctomycetaceae bacterium]|nr:hypothetical protein [Planctomycetaceae bacterium]
MVCSLLPQAGCGGPTPISSAHCLAHSAQFPLDPARDFEMTAAKRFRYLREDDATSCSCIYSEHASVSRLVVAVTKIGMQQTANHRTVDDPRSYSHALVTHLQHINVD